MGPWYRGLDVGGCRRRFCDGFLGEVLRGRGLDSREERPC